MAGILIVDDDPSIRAMFARSLRALGEVEQASNGADALRMLGARKYSIVLLDLHMPVIDGFVILHTLSTKPGPNRDTPIYVVTADASDQARVRALRRHAVFLLTKPVPLATLTSLVDSALRKAAARAARADDAEDEAAVVTPPREASSSSPGRTSMAPREPSNSSPGRTTPPPFRPTIPSKKP